MIVIATQKAQGVVQIPQSRSNREPTAGSAADIFFAAPPVARRQHDNMTRTSLNIRLSRSLVLATPSGNDRYLRIPAVPGGGFE